MKVKVYLYLGVCPVCNKVVKAFTERQCRSALESHIKAIHNEEPPEKLNIKRIEFDAEVE